MTSWVVIFFFFFLGLVDRFGCMYISPRGSYIMSE